MEIKDNRDENKESPKIRRLKSNNNSIPRALSAKDENNNSKQATEAHASRTWCHMSLLISSLKQKCI